jgi:hypothetical protein
MEIIVPNSTDPMKNKSAVVGMKTINSPATLLPGMLDPGVEVTGNVVTEQHTNELPTHLVVFDNQDRIVSHKFPDRQALLNLDFFVSGRWVLCDPVDRVIPSAKPSLKNFQQAFCPVPESDITRNRNWCVRSESRQAIDLTTHLGKINKLGKAQRSSGRCADEDQQRRNAQRPRGSA